LLNNYNELINSVRGNTGNNLQKQIDIIYDKQVIDHSDISSLKILTTSHTTSITNHTERLITAENNISAVQTLANNNKNRLDLLEPDVSTLKNTTVPNLRTDLATQI